MATVFWDAKGIIFIDFIGKSKTINGEYYYANLLQWLSDNISKKYDLSDKKKIVFHYDNVSAHSSVVAIVNELRIEMYAYRLNIAPNNYHRLFANRWWTTRFENTGLNFKYI